ncbi:AAA family ATPase [Geobacter sulfurreducens]|uniref:YhaN family protein n=1 Tax=Geobacter sulfurreducens TaxID=35554 RepID=UPI001BDD9CDB|nr:YhaN family protein [Geobacter sulfurreducens]QVW35327.1 AAA family ATPase [Geobacter sulfurreducens]
MRIKRLELKAFGPFSDRTLDFSSDLPGLHVVYGPNEAGKSSSMRALQALFFGFPVRTSDNFLHSYDQLLVGGCLQGGDGRELTFYRRKKSKNSLFDQHDNPLDPAVLTPFLHGLEQDLFTTLYGIDHETLVRGGQGILEQQGEVGQALFAAGTGLASLKSIVDELDREGDSLFKPRGSTQTITMALAEYKDLQAKLKSATLSSREWQEHQRALDEAEKKLENANESRGKLNKEKRRLERLKQALPYLGQRGNLLEKLAELGEVVELPSDFGERRKALEDQERGARFRFGSTNDRLRDLEDNKKGVSLNQGLLDHAEAIEELLQGLGQYRKAKADRPQLDGRRIGCRTETANLLKQIRPGISIDEVETLRPSLAKRKTIQTLGARHEALLQGARKARRLVQTTVTDLENARNDLETLSPVADIVKLSQAIMLVQKAGDLDGEITAKRQDLNTLRQGSLAALNRLGLWSGPLDLVGQLALPLPETLHRYEEEFSSIAEGKRQLQAERLKLENERAQLTEQLHEIEFATEVPSEEELTQHRNRRDRGWQLLRRQWLWGEDVAAESREYDTENPLPDAYEKLVGISDQTADRLYREADRVQKHASLKARVEGIDKRMAELGQKEMDVEAVSSEATRRWQELWAPCAITPLSPREMHAWLSGFDKIRFQVEESEKIARDLAGREARRRELRTLLLTELAALGEQPDFPGEGLSPVLQFAEMLVQRMKGDQSRCDSLSEKIRDLENALEIARRDQEVAEEELRQWQALWDDAVAPLGIESKTLPAEASEFIETLQGCFDKLKEADDFRKRIDGIDRDARVFEEAVLELAKEIDPDLAGLDTPQVVLQFKSRVGRAAQDKALVQQYSEEIDTLGKTLVDTQAELDSIDEQMAALRQLAGCLTEEELNEVERRSNEYLKFKEKLEEVEEALARIAEGIPFADLEIQAQGIDPDELPGRIEALTNEIEGKLDPEIRQLSETIGREKNELTRMDGSGKAAELAEASQQALAKIRRLTERYIRVKLATKILREEIERYRAENQDPVLKIASRYFSELTLGSLVGLRTDIDDHGQPVLIGVRPNGAWLHVGGMSSGTRDQLYLALRLATLEWRMQSAEPMPFIVDDILINFDDKRSIATLRALADLAEKTQVILFTHHNQVFEAARALNSNDKVLVHQL